MHKEEVIPMAVDQKGFWASFWGGAKDAGIVSEAETAVGAQVAGEPLRLVAAEPLAPVVSKAESDAEITRLRAELAKVQAEQIQKDAQTFAAAELSASRAYPVEKEPMAALYVRAAEMDVLHPREDGQPSCVALVQAAYTARPAHQLSKPLIPNTPPQGTVLANEGDSEAAELDRAEASARKYAERANGKRA
jgi:hypothetical protein